jgi:hypothetical protein
LYAVARPRRFTPRPAVRGKKTSRALWAVEI